MTVVVDLLKASNPNCFIVTGRPRTPRDQGSVESANKVVQQVLKCISSDNRCKIYAMIWDTTYSVNVFPPAKAFDGEKIDPTKNRHILRLMFQGVPLIAELVKYFEEKYTNLEVRSGWIIEKSRENDGFQSWHRDFYLGTEVTTTIAVDVGAVTKD